MSKHLFGTLRMTWRGLIFKLMLIFYHMGIFLQKKKFDPRATSKSPLARGHFSYFLQVILGKQGEGAVLVCGALNIAMRGLILANLESADIFSQNRVFFGRIGG